MSDFDVNSVFTNSLVGLVNGAVKTMVRVLPDEDADERFD
jgi:hypothetical protein